MSFLTRARGRNFNVCSTATQERPIATIFLIFFLKDIQTIFNFCHNIYHRRRHTATKLLLLSSILFVIQVFFASLYTKHSHNIKQQRQKEESPITLFLVKYGKSMKRKRKGFWLPLPAMAAAAAIKSAYSMKVTLGP